MALNRLLRGGLAALLVVAQSLAMAQAPAPAAPKVLADTVYDNASLALFWGDWDELEQLYAASRTDLQRADEGGLASCRFGQGVGRSYNNESQVYQETVVAATLAWTRSRPDSPLAHAIHLEALVDQAWFFRGGGFAKTVSDQRFADFKAKLNEALAYAKAHGAVMGRGDNYYIRPLLMLLRGMSVGVRQQLEIARKGLRKDATDDCIYLAAIPSLLPKWGGEPEELERWIRESMKGLPEKDALQRYARFYNSATDGDYEQTLFEASLARWPLMRDGLRALISESPKGRYWKNRLAYFACMVKDRETAVPALEAVEAATDFDAWGPTGQRNYQACKRWALQS
jgi:hypothetical protein